VGFFILAFVVGSLSPMRSHYLAWQYKQQKASDYLSTEVCMDPVVRAKLGEHTLCDQSQTIVDTSAIEAAFFQTMKDIHFCQDAGCYFFWMELTGNLWKIAVVGVIVLIILMALGFLRINTQKEAYYELPGGRRMTAVGAAPK
jgi:hypothetical protein